MYAQVERPKENKIRAVAYSVVQKKGNEKQGLAFIDNRDKPQISTTKFTREPAIPHVIQGKWHVQATCNVHEIQKTETSQSSIPINWAVKLMEPAMKEETNPLFQCAEAKSLSASLRVYTPSKEYGISNELLENIYWEDVKWYGNNKEGEDIKNRDGKSRKEGDQADPCETCRTWTEGDGSYLTIKEEDLNMVKQAEGVELYDKEYQRLAENKRRDVEKAFNEKIIFLKNFSKWSSIIEGNQDELDERMITVAAMDDDLYQKVNKYDLELGYCLKKKSEIIGNSTTNKGDREKLELKMQEIWKEILKVIKESVSQELE